VYALTEPKHPYAIRYIGSTINPVEVRFKHHRTHRKAMDYNPDLSAWLQDVIPLVEVRGEVDESERWAREKQAICEFGQRYKLLNRYWNYSRKN
jgi:hypothetical protein